MRPSRKVKSSLECALLGSLLLCALPAVRAGEVAVELRERGGGPLVHQAVSLDLEPPSAWARPEFVVHTDARGIAAFREVPAGSYRVSVADLASELVRPEENPYAPPPVVTLVDDADSADLRLELWRGVRVSGRVEVDRGRTPGATVVFHNLDSGKRLEGRTHPSGHAEKLLVPGRWRVGVEPLPGHLLVGFAVDGVASQDHDILLTLREYDPASYLVWQFSAPANVGGHVDFLLDEGTLEIRADLIEPGPWIEEARRRGGSAYERVSGSLIVDRYDMVLPSGRWRLQPVATSLVSSEPASIELELAPGDYAQADFAVQIDHGSRRSVLEIIVQGPEEEPIADAAVEVWTVDASWSPLATVLQGRSGKFGTVVLTGAPKGPLLVVAGHSSYLEGRARVEIHDPQDREPTPVRVELPAGATLWTRAVDEEQDDVTGVLLEVERQGPLGPLVIADEAFAESKRARASLTDATGYARVEGLYPGRYRVTGRLLGERSSTRFVRVALPQGLPAPTLDLNIDAVTETETRLVILPAASFRGSLSCIDGGPFPPAASLRAFDAGTPGGDPRLDPELRSGAILTIDERTLDGPALDGFVAGPLEPGTYHLALRPSGLDRWTWAMNAERRAEAVLLHADEAQATETGLLTLDCAPAIWILPAVENGEALPDMRDVEVDAEVVRLVGDGSTEAVDAEIAQYRDVVQLRDLPDGRLRVRYTLMHPHFLDRPRVEGSVEIELRRGELHSEEPSVSGIGGALQIKGHGALVRIRGRAGAFREAVPAEGKVFVPSLPPDLYRVELCADQACETPSRLWEPVRVEARRTLYLD